ncbi:PPPDE putative peptidase domain-containing protein, partial [Baffinella frigidus]
VTLHVYDLSGGLARQMSQAFIGKQIDGVWHTGVVVYGREYFFGGGIQNGVPGRTPYGSPVERVPLGETHIPEEVFEEFIQDISSRFSVHNYDLLDNNCNNFSAEASLFLTGNSIPAHITGLPAEVLLPTLTPI